MANFAIAATHETIERANKVMELYAQDGDKKEDTLLRILEIAENESVRGTHPELESSLREVDTTISVLIKQINGIVSGQDLQIETLKQQVNSALEDKNAAIQTAQEQTAQAEELVRKVTSESAAEKEYAQNEIQKSYTEKEQAIRERDDARALFAEKASSNDLLMKKMTEMQEDIKSYKAMQESYKTLEANISILKKELADKEHELETSKLQAELAIEKAIYAKEKELQDALRAADKENARLLAKIENLQEMLQKQVTDLS